MLRISTCKTSITLVFFWPFLFFSERWRPSGLHVCLPRYVLCYFNHAEWHIVTAALHVHHTPGSLDFGHNTWCTFGLLYHIHLVSLLYSGLGLRLHHCATVVDNTLQFTSSKVASADCLFDIVNTHITYSNMFQYQGQCKCPHY